VAFEYIIGTLGGVPVSEVPRATSKRTTVPVCNMGTSSLTVPGGTEDADFLLEGDALLRVYEVDDFDPSAPRNLLAHHRLVTAEEVGDENGVTVAATFADPLWVLLRRLAGKSAAGYVNGTALATVDRGAIIADLVNTTNAESLSGVAMGTVTPSSSTYIAPGQWFYKPITEAIAELSAVLDGPDFRVRPVEYSGGTYGVLDVTPSLATMRPDAVFEYGAGLLNVRNFRRAVTLEGTLNRPINLPSGFPDNAVGTVLQRDDAASQARRGLLEGLVSSDLTVDALRGLLLDAHLSARKGPRQTFTFEPVSDLGGRVPKVGRDFNVGDVLPFRVTITRDGEEVKRANLLVRVYSYDVTVDTAGVGTFSLTVTPT
jgi:hypothetical protein